MPAMPQTSPPKSRRRFLRVLLVILAAVILLPALAVLAVVTMFDADSAKPRIVAAVHAATGRDLLIAGPIRLVPGLHPSIELTDATLSNPPGFSRPQMATLNRLNLRVALLPLLNRRVEIDSLIVHGADILLEMNADGTGNWRFKPAPAATNGATGPAPASPNHSPSIHIDAIEIDDGQIAYRNPRMRHPVEMAIDKLKLDVGAETAPVELSMTAVSENTPFTLSGRIGRYDALFGNSALPLNLDLKLTAAGATLSASGSIADPVRMAGTELRLGADIPDLAALSALARTPLPRLQAIAAQTRLTDLAGKPGLLAGFTLHDLKLSFPQAQLDGEISVTRGSPPLLQGTLHAARIDVDALRSARPLPSSPAAPQPAGAAPPSPAAPEAGPGRLISDRELPFDALRGLDADLTIAIAELLQNGVTYRDIAGHIVLQDSALRIDPFTATIPGGPVQASLAIDAARPGPPVALRLSAPSVSLAPLLASFRLPPYAQGDMRVDADLHGAGRSLRQIAATLDGTAGLSMENAQIDTRALGEMLNSIETLKSGKTGFTALRCVAARMDAQDGAGTIRALLLDTTPIRLSGTGGVNLAEETLALRLNTTVRMGTTGISAPLDIGGTFALPRVRIDTARPGAGTNANTPFGLVIGRLNAMQGAADSSCAHDLAIARGETPPPEPTTEAPPNAKPPKPADLLRQLLR